jgi:hypothetical protein
MSKHSSLMPDDRERPAPSTKKERKTVVVEYKAKPGQTTLFFRDWAKFGAYANLERAKQVLQAKGSDPYFDYRIRPTS